MEIFLVVLELRTPKRDTLKKNVGKMCSLNRKLSVFFFAQIQTNKKKTLAAAKKRKILELYKKKNPNHMKMNKFSIYTLET